MIPCDGIATFFALTRKTPKSRRRNTFIRLRAAMPMNKEDVTIRIKDIGGTDGGHVGGKLREDCKSPLQSRN